MTASINYLNDVHTGKYICLKLKIIIANLITPCGSEGLAPLLQRDLVFH